MTSDQPKNVNVKMSAILTTIRAMRNGEQHLEISHTGGKLHFQLLWGTCPLQCLWWSRPRGENKISMSARNTPLTHITFDISHNEYKIPSKTQHF